MHLPQLLAHAICLITACTAITIFPPSGPYQVEYSTLQLADFSRKNPWAKDPPQRSIMASVFTPIDNETACRKSRIPYMPSAVAEYYDNLFSPYNVPNGTFGAIDLALCSGPQGSGPAGPADRPTVIFSPGLGNSRFLYSIMASTIASLGFNVVTIDHPYDAPVVVFPDGAVIKATNISTEAQITKAMEVRSDDILFVASALQKRSHFSRADAKLRDESMFGLWQYLIKVIDALAPNNQPQHPDPIFAAGHSLGGAAAVDAAHRSPTIEAAANLDGSLWGAATLPATTLSTPVLLFRRESNASKPTWDGIWPRLLGPKLELELMNSTHGTFTDLPFLADALGLRENLSTAVNDLLGTLPGMEAMASISETMATWFESIGDGEADEAVDATDALAKERGDVLVVRRSC